MINTDKKEEVKAPKCPKVPWYKKVADSVGNALGEAFANRN